MDTLLPDLFDLMSQRCGHELTHSQQYRDCTALRERHFSRVREAMGEEFCEKLSDIVAECAQLHTEAAFAWGLRLGLSLPSL